MTQASLLSPAHRSPAKSSRLLRFLAELLDADADVSHQRFIERLGQSFDLADSIKISAVHDKRTETVGTAAVADRNAIKDEFQHVRAAIESSVLQSFAPGAGAIRLRFPQAHAEMASEEAMAPEPYLAFYVAQQRNIYFRIRDLHVSTRDAIANLSPQLARLAALDAVLAVPLSGPARQSFAAVPRLLGRRFDVLQEEFRTGRTEHADTHEHRKLILQQFREEMQGLLLAEIETRLLPTLGLIEALDENDGY